MNKDNASALAISSTSIRRHGLTLSEYFQTKTVSVMFDEASDIQMHKHLNDFVNVSTKALTLFYLYCNKLFYIYNSIPYRVHACTFCMLYSYLLYM